MRYLQIELAKPGMKLGHDVLDTQNRILVSQDAILTEQYISRLMELGVPAIYIDDEYSKGIDIQPPISPVLRSEGLTAVKSMNIDNCRLVAKRIVEEMLDNGFHSLDMQDLRTYDDYTFAHSVNVAIMSCTVGFGINLNQDQLVDLVFSALLHDLGKIDLPVEIINKPGPLTREEYTLVKTHPQKSYEMISDRLDISSMVKNAVLCHHENHDGSGYPNGLSEYNIALLARIIHVTDVYDALTSMRPYKEPYSPYAAIEVLQGGRGTQFDPVMVDAFLRYVPIYPKGTEVTLSDGRVAIVVENSGEHNERPIVRTKDLAEIDLASEEASELIITSPSAQDFSYLQSNEERRKQMLQPLPRYNILVIDPVGDTYHNLTEQLGYLYNFRCARDEFMAQGYIKKDGDPDLILVDIDTYDLSNPRSVKAQNEYIAQKYPIIVLGSYRDVKTISMLRGLGIQNYVLKPFPMLYLQLEMNKKIESLLLN